MSKQTEEERHREIERAEVDRLTWGTSMLEVDNEGNLRRVPPSEIPVGTWRTLDASR